MSASPALGKAPSPPRRKVRAEVPTEPRARGPRKVIATARNVAHLLEQHPALWPGLTTCITDTDGRMIVHYAVGGDSRDASFLFGPDGVVARWRSVLSEVQEAHRERGKGRERVVTVRGTYSGCSVTVLFTVISGG